jgi:hypothetical protein
MIIRKERVLRDVSYAEVASVAPLGIRGEGQQTDEHSLYVSLS